jgi:hypothetical protein
MPHPYLTAIPAYLFTTLRAAQSIIARMLLQPHDNAVDMATVLHVSGSDPDHPM